MHNGPLGEVGLLLSQHHRAVYLMSGRAVAITTLLEEEALRSASEWYWVKVFTSKNTIGVCTSCGCFGDRSVIFCCLQTSFLSSIFLAHPSLGTGLEICREEKKRRGGGGGEERRRRGR